VQYSAWKRQFSQNREQPVVRKSPSPIDIETCRRCGGTLEVIASIEDPALIERILAHRRERAEDDVRSTPFAPRAPPLAYLF
jgi:hypothetical protein